MVTGGCGNGGEGRPAVTPTPERTGFPPECDGTFNVDLSCPAASLAGSVCLPYICDVIDGSASPAEVVDTITLVFGNRCTDNGCFTLECQDIFNGSVINLDAATIIVESVSGTPVGENTQGRFNTVCPEA